MTEDVAFGASVALLALGTAWVLWLMYSLKRGVALLRKESSRFPMYEARDRLVLLVAAGELAKDEKGWRIAYQAVNAALDMHKESNALTVFKKFIEFQERLRADASLQARVRELKRAEEIACRRSRRFRSVLDSADRAFWFMVTRQSYRWQCRVASRLIQDFVDSMPARRRAATNRPVQQRAPSNDNCYVPDAGLGRPRPARGEVAAFVLPPAKLSVAHA